MMLICVSSAQSGPVRIRAFFQHSLSLWPFRPTVPGVHHALSLPAFGTTLTLPTRGGFGTIVSISIMFWFYSYPPRPPRLRGLSTSVYNILLSVRIFLNAPAWFSSTRSIDYNSKKDGIFSLMQTIVQHALNFDANPPRQTRTISSSLMIMLMEARNRKSP